MTNKKYHIHKSGGVIIKNRKLLVTKKKGKDFFIAPGGKLEPEENAIQALVRELFEEVKLQVKKEDFEEFGSFYAQATGEEDKIIRMDVYLVKTVSSDPEPNSEIEEIAWISSVIPEGMKVGSIFEHQVIPKLKELGLID